MTTIANGCEMKTPQPVMPMRSCGKARADCMLADPSQG